MSAHGATRLRTLARTAGKQLAQHVGGLAGQCGHVAAEDGKAADRMNANLTGRGRGGPWSRAVGGR